MRFDLYKTNVVGTLNMLGLAKRVGARFLLTSTSEVYGDPLQHPQVETYWGNVNPIGTFFIYYYFYFRQGNWLESRTCVFLGISGGYGVSRVRVCYVETAQGSVI